MDGNGIYKYSIIDYLFYFMQFSLYFSLVGNNFCIQNICIFTFMKNYGKLLKYIENSIETKSFC